MNYLDRKQQLTALLEEVAKRHGVTAEQLRTADSEAAQRARYDFCREASAASWSTTMIGRALRRDHTTVLFWLNRLSSKVPQGRVWRESHA